MSGIYIPWLADAARMTGYPVSEVGGWPTRGHGGFRVVECVATHHTATSRAAPGDYPSLRVVRDGRAGLPGPLCNLGLGRSGTIYVVAAGVAYHAGASAWAGYYDLNDEAIGIEAENDGVGEPWSADQLDAYCRLVAALLYYMRRDASRFAGHKDIALPKGRKIDPAGIDTGWMRAHVAAYLAAPATIHRGATPAPGPEREHVVAGGQTLSAIGRLYGVPWQQIATLNGLSAPFTITPGQRLRVPGGQSAPAPTPTPRPTAPGWPLPRDHYFGLITGPAKSHGGYYPAERANVRLIQQALIRKGYVPGVSDPNSGWADGRFEQPTKDAVTRFQRAEMPGTTRFGEVWWDDWAKLLG